MKKNKNKTIELSEEEEEDNDCFKKINKILTKTVLKEQKIKNLKNINNFLKFNGLISLAY